MPEANDLNKNPTTPTLVNRVYSTIEARAGYRLILGGTRHFGYYESGTKWPFPIKTALRKMEGRLFNTLALDRGAKVLDAGCGVGHVAIHLARKGLRVHGIDVTTNHLRWARENVHRHGLQDSVRISPMDFHHLDTLHSASFDGIYTMETWYHASDPEQALSEFYRTLKPGGRIVFHNYEYAHGFLCAKCAPPQMAKSVDAILKGSAIGDERALSKGALQAMLENQGFENIEVEDLTENIWPMIYLFYVLAYIPILFIRLFGLRRWFVNTTGGAIALEAGKLGMLRYLVLSADKPRTGSHESALGAIKTRKRVEKDLCPFAGHQ